jgi:peroxiredoxin
MTAEDIVAQSMNNSFAMQSWAMDLDAEMFLDAAASVQATFAKIGVTEDEVRAEGGHITY